MKDAIDTLNDGLMTTAEACTFLRIGKTKLYEMMVLGELPSTMIGSQRRIPRSAVLDLAARGLENRLGQRADSSETVAQHGSAR